MGDYKIQDNNLTPIRILHNSGVMNRGGQETLLMELYRHIDRNKVQFDFLLYNYGQQGAFDDEIRSMGGRIYNLYGKFYKNPVAYCVELNRFFEEHREYDIVHAHQYKMSGFVLNAAKKYGVKYAIAHSHIANTNMGTNKGVANKLRKISGSIGGTLINKRADFVFGCAEDALVEMTGMRADDKTRFVLRNATNPEKYKFNAALREKWRKQFNAKADTIIVGNIARFTYQKNHEHTIRTFAEIVTMRSDSLLILIGVGDRQQEMKNLAAELGIEDKVRFMDSRSDVNEIINAFDVFLLPSRYEGLGIVFIEAQANGLPCVMSADVIPEEADVGAGLVTRVDLNKPANYWAEKCIEAASKGRLEPDKSVEAVKAAGYDIKEVARWLQDFYLNLANGQ